MENTEVFKVSTLVQRVKDVAGYRLSPKSVNYYVKICLIEPAGKQGNAMLYTDLHVKHILMIKRLMGPSFRYSLEQIRDRVKPLFTDDEFAELAGQPTPRVENDIRRRRPR